MSKPNLPPLPPEAESVYVSVDGLSTYREARDCYYTMDQMYAYAEEAVRQALAAQAMLYDADEEWFEELMSLVTHYAQGAALNGHASLPRHIVRIQKHAALALTGAAIIAERAAIREALKGMQRWFGKWPEFVPADDKVADAAQAVAAMNAVLPETRDG